MGRTSNVWKTIRLFKWKSVFFKYFFSLFVIILIILVPYNLLLFKYYNYILANEISVQSSTNALKSKNIFDLLTSSFHKNYNFACGTAFIQDFLQADLSADFASGTSAARDFADSMVANTEYADEIFIYSFVNNHYLSSGGITLATKENAWPWLNTYLSTKLPLILFPRKVASEQFDYLYICREIYDQENNVIGIFCTRIRYEDFERIIAQSFEEKPEKIFIVSDIGLILYSDDPALINTLMFERNDIYTAFNEAKSLEGNTILFNDYIISVAKSEHSGLILMSYFSNNFLMRNYGYLQSVILFATATIFIAAVLISLYISLKQYRSVSQVMETLADPDKLGHDKGMLSEFFYISNTISALSHKNEEITDELSEKIVSLKRSQIAALQSQINPHFLFNTLQLINLSIIRETKADTQSTYLIAQLSELLRTSYDTERYLVTVREEIENVTKYLNIQRARYCNRLQVQFDIAPDSLDCETLKLLLQPFVENSIVHGFKGKSGDWRIRLRCFRQEDFLVYEITDNGSGIEPAELERINDDLRRTRGGRNGSIGIANVNQRLKLLYGNRCSVTIGPNSAGETVVTLSHETGCAGAD